MILTLIRHGQTGLGASGRYCGSLDVPLNENGREQSEKLSERFKGTSIDAVYSSGLIRARETAEIIFKGTPIIEQPCFQEMGFGALEGLSYEEAMLQYADIYRAWINDPWGISLPGAENFKDFSVRVMQGLDGLLSRHQSKSVVLVSHSGPIKLILLKALGRPVKDFWTIRQENAAVNTIDYRPPSMPQVITMNDTKHLMMVKQ